MSELQQDPNNANRGTEEGRRLVAHSLTTVGAGRSVLADRDNTLVGGNKTAEAWGDRPVRFIDSDGSELIVVRRTDLDLDSPDPEVRHRSRLAAYLDNQAASLGLDWNPEAFQRDLADGLDLSHVFSEDSLATILAPVLPDTEPDQMDFGEFPDAEPPADNMVKFKFGDYSGLVEQAVYDAFVTRYRTIQEETTEVILSDVLAAWLHLEGEL